MHIQHENKVHTYKLGAKSMKKVWDYLRELFLEARKLSAVTLGEILISMAIIGALVLILMPILQSVKPDENEAMHKKTTFVVERVVNELSSDDYLYPNNGEYSSLSNIDSVTYNGVTHGGTTKFCTLFASRINKKPGTEVNCTAGAVSVTSVEGVDWYLPISNFRNGSETLMVDVNGGEEPNELGEDRFEYQIQPGFKVPTIEVTHYENATERPDDKATVGNVVKPDHEDKAGLGKYNIACTGDGHATILGVGSGKVNGNYTLVAIPKPGYKCNWFTRQVTVKDADVTDCALSCSPDSVVPESDGGTTPGGDDDDDDDDEDPKNPVNVVVNWSGESGCNYICDKNDCMYYEGELYKVTITGDNGKHLEAVWLPGSSGSGVIMGEETVIERAECKKVETQKCYDIKPIVGNPNHCPYQLPAGNCPNEGEENKYLPNQDYGIVVSPEEGYTFNNTPDKSTYTVKLGNSDAKPDFRNLCKNSTPVCPDPATAGIRLQPQPHGGGGGFHMSAQITLSHALPVDVEVTFTGRDDKGTNFGGTFKVPKGSTTAVVDAGGDTSQYGSTLTGQFESATPAECITEVSFDGTPPEQIRIDTTGAASSGHEISGKGTDSILVKNRDKGDATITGIKVIPSNTNKSWKLTTTGDMWQVSPKSGTGEKGLTVTLGKNMGNDPVCMVASYSGTTTQSNEVCFTFENPIVDQDKIEIKVGSLSATYGGYNPTGTTPSVSYSNGTVTVKTAQDVTISGLSVVPSNSSKPWKIKKTGSEESVVTPSSGSGTKSFTVELAKNHFTGGCVYAEYNDKSAHSNNVCFSIEGNGVEGSCDPSNKYNIKVTEKQDSTVDKYFEAIGDPNSSIVGGGPWYTSNPYLSYQGEGTVNGGTKLELTFNKPSPGGTVNGVTYEAYVKKVTVNGKSQNTGSYSVVVCENQNITVEYGMKEKTAPSKNVSITMYWTDDSGKFNNTTMGTHCGSNASGRYTNPDGTSGNFTDNPANGQKATVKAGATLYLNQSTSDCDVRPTSTEGTLCKPKGITIEGNSISGTYQVSGNTSVTSLTGYYHWDCEDAGSEVSKISVTVRGSSSGIQIQSWSVSISGPTSIDKTESGTGAPSASKTYNAAAGSYRVNSSTATIKYGGKTVNNVPITWSPTSFSLAANSSKTVTGTISYSGSSNPTISYSCYNTGSSAGGMISLRQGITCKATLSSSSSTYYPFSVKIKFPLVTGCPPQTPTVPQPGTVTFSGTINPGSTSYTKQVWSPPSGFNWGSCSPGFSPSGITFTAN